MLQQRARLSPLCWYGHVADYAELLADSHGQESAVVPYRMNVGLTRHLRANVYVCAHLSERELSAAWCGGLLDCVTVLAEAGLPLDERSLTEPHLRFPRGDTRAAARRHEHAPTSRMHWSRLRTPVPTIAQAKDAARSGEPLSRLKVPFREALRQAMTSCVSYAMSAELIEATVASQLCPIDDLAQAILVAPRRVELALRELEGIPAEVDVALAALRSGHRF